MNQTGWEPASGQLWWPWPLDEAGVAALQQQFTNRSLLGAFAGGVPQPGDSVVSVLLAVNPEQRAAVLDTAGKAVPGPDVTALVRGLSADLGAAVEIDGIEYEAPAPEAALELEAVPEPDDAEEFEAPDAAELRTVLVGKFRREDLLMFGALNGVEVHVLESGKGGPGAPAAGQRIVLVHGEAAPGLYNWPASAKPIVALMDLDGFRAVEAWLPGTRRDPDTSFWHAWEGPAKPFPSASRADAEALRLLGRIVHPEGPDPRRLSEVLGLEPGAVQGLQELMASPDEPGILARAGQLLELPPVAARLAEGSLQPDRVPGMETLPVQSLGKALLELASSPAEGRGPLAAWQRAVVARPGMLAGSAAAAATGAALLFRAAGRRPASARLLRAGALGLVLQAAGDVALGSYLAYRRRR
ncbi:hypothetical protein [Arthrobacter sp.]|uniref:hypothetical protein n=1 Tax=Arthrobacter sp. TaxID=1667 RepID=UPI003393967F